MFITADEESEIRGILVPSFSFWLQIIYALIRITLVLGIISALVILGVLFTVGFISDKTAIMFIYAAALFLLILFCLSSLAFIPLVQGIYFKRARTLLSISYSLIRRLHKILFLKISIIAICLALYYPLLHIGSVLFAIPYRFFLFFLVLTWTPYFSAFFIILLLRRQEFLRVTKNAFSFIKTRWIKSSYCAFLSAASAMMLGIVIFYMIRYFCIFFFAVSLPQNYLKPDALPLLERLPEIIPSFVGMLFGCFAAISAYCVVMTLLFLRAEANDEASSVVEYFESCPLKEQLSDNDFMEMFKNVKEVQVDLSNPERTERFGAISPQNRAEVLRVFEQDEEESQTKNFLLSSTQKNLLKRMSAKRDIRPIKPYTRMDSYPDVNSVRPEAKLTAPNFYIIEPKTDEDNL